MTPAVAAKRPSRKAGATSIAAVVMTLAFVWLATVHFREQPPAAPELRLEISTPSTTEPLDFALSPDGRYIAFQAAGDGPERLWLRELDQTDAKPLTGTDGGTFPFWSPDSRSLGFFTAGKLKRIDLAGGAPRTLANVSGAGGSWNADGAILFPSGRGILRIAAAGGEPVAAVTKPDPRLKSFRFPQFLPDGRHFLFSAIDSLEGSGIYLSSLDGGAGKRLAAADSAAAYVPPGFIVFARQTTLMAQRLDLKNGVLTGDPIPVADPVGANKDFNGFSVSADGRLAYRGAAGSHQLVWYDRTGKEVVGGGEPQADTNGLLYPGLSPDGRRVVIQRLVQNTLAIWLMDLLRGGFTRLTFGGGEWVPVWSPDGSRIAFGSSQTGQYNLYVKPSSGVGTEELLLETANLKFAQDWSWDGRFLLYAELDRKTGRDLWALAVTGSDRKPVAIANTPFDERNGQFSPNGRWVAYETNESGRFEIVVQPFPAPTAKWPVSTNGGVQPRWRADGKELYFIAPDRKMMAASITDSGATFAAATPTALFSTRLASETWSYKQQYAVSPDGRFLLNQVAESSSAPITLILNWKPPTKLPEH